MEESIAFQTLWRRRVKLGNPSAAEITDALKRHDGHGGMAAHDLKNRVFHDVVNESRDDLDHCTIGNGSSTLSTRLSSAVCPYAGRREAPSPPISNVERQGYVACTHAPHPCLVVIICCLQERDCSRWHRDYSTPAEGAMSHLLIPCCVLVFLAVGSNTHPESLVRKLQWQLGSPKSAAQRSSASGGTGRHSGVLPELGLGHSVVYDVQNNQKPTLRHTCDDSRIYS